MRKINRT